MSQSISAQHPAVVLRSHYNNLRNLLAVAMVGLVGLSGAVVILADDQDSVGGTIAGKSAESANPVGSPRYFEGVQAGTAGSTALPPGVRFDGGPEEGTRGATTVQPPLSRYDGGPEEGTRGIVAAQAPGQRYDGGPEEGTRDIGSASAESPLAPGFSTD
jgi:hypothetical protein